MNTAIMIDCNLRFILIENVTLVCEEKGNLNYLLCQLAKRSYEINSGSFRVATLFLEIGTLGNNQILVIAAYFLRSEFNF